MIVQVEWGAPVGLLLEATRVTTVVVPDASGVGHYGVLVVLLDLQP